MIYTEQWGSTLAVLSTVLNADDEPTLLGLATKEHSSMTTVKNFEIKMQAECSVDDYDHVLGLCKAYLWD